MDANYTDCFDCKLHTGFKNCFDKTVDQATTGVLALHVQYPSYDIMVTGHSLGGALANLLSVSLVQKGLKVIHYSFGSPRVSTLKKLLFYSFKFIECMQVGNQAFSDYVKSLQMVPQRITHYKGTL